MATENEIRLGRRTPETLLAIAIKGMVALTVLWVVLFLLPGCDGEFERLQAEAEFNAKVARTLPKKGELVTIKQFSDGHYVIRRYDRGLKETYVLAREDGE